MFVGINTVDIFLFFLIVWHNQQNKDGYSVVVYGNKGPGCRSLSHHSIRQKDGFSPACSYWFT